MTDTKQIQALTEEQAADFKAFLAVLGAEAQRALCQFGESVNAMAEQTAATIEAHRVRP